MSRSPLGPFRHQLASTSPVRWRGLGRALRAMRGGPALGAELEALLCREYGVAGAFSCGSGTQALTWSLAVAERISRAEGAAVAIPAYQCFDVGAAAAAFGRPIRLYDLDPKTLGPDPKSLGAALRAGARTVVVATLYGVPIDWTTLTGLFDAGVVVVEDAAQGHGGRWQGRRLGGFGRLGVLSFGRGKGWTGGTGGALLVRDHADLDAVRSHPLLGTASGGGVVLRALAHRVLGRPSIYRVPRSLPFLGLGETRYRPAREPGPMAAASAALLLDSRDLSEREVDARAHAAAEYRTRIDRSGTARVVAVPAGGTAGYVRFPVLLDAGMAGFADPKLAERLGAAPGYPAALGTLPAVATLVRGSTDAPGADRLVRELVTLPTHGLVRAEEREALLELLPG